MSLCVSVCVGGGVYILGLQCVVTCVCIYTYLRVSACPRVSLHEVCVSLGSCVWPGWQAEVGKRPVLPHLGSCY